MGTESVPRALFSMSLPIIISMIVQALYNIVDSVFVAEFDPKAGTAALTMAFPVQNLMIAVAAGLGVGMNALLSRSLGQKNHEKANKVAAQGIILALCGYLIFLVFGLFLVEPFVGLQSENALSKQYGIDYISIVAIGSLGLFLQVTTERLLQATGKSIYSMVTQATGAIVNIILDPIMIFGLLGCPKMGVTGAAIATIIGQFVAGILGIIFNLKCNRELKFGVKYFKPEGALIREILVIGIPSVLMQAIGSLMTFSMNLILGGFGEEAMNVFGIYFKLQSFVFMPIFGLTNGMIPLVSYNYGADKPKRVFALIKLSMICSISYMALGLIIFQAFPSALLAIFNAEGALLEIGRAALRIISIGFLFAGFAIISSSVCQALGKSVYSLLLSVARQLVVLIPTAFLLSLSGEVNLVWLALPISEFVSFLVSIYFLIRVLRKFFVGKEEDTASESAVF